MTKKAVDDKPKARRSRAVSRKKNKKENWPIEKIDVQEITEKRNSIDRIEKEELKPRYIPIEENDPETEGKKKLLWLIVGLLSLVIVFVWFWSLRQSLARENEDNQLAYLSQQVEQTIGNLKNSFSEKQAEDIDRLKQDLIEGIKTDIALNSGDWKTSTSTDMNLVLRYPPSWQVQDLGNTLVISSFNSTDTPEIFAQAIIAKNSNTLKLDLETWFGKNNEIGDYEKATSTAQIADQPALKYIKKGNGEEDISEEYILIKGKDIYEIKIFSLKGKSTYGVALNRIVKELKFIK